MTELSYALASGQQYAGLTPVEQAAAEKDLHLSTCDEPYLEDCGICQTKLARIRRVIEAVRPVIEAEVREQEREHYEEELRGQCLVAYNEGVLASVEKPVGRHAVSEGVEGGDQP